MIQPTIFSPACTYTSIIWILHLFFFCLIASAVPTESPSNLFDTSQDGLNSLNLDQQTNLNLDFWNNGDDDLLPKNFADDSAGTTSTSSALTDPDSDSSDLDLFDPVTSTTSTFSAVGGNDPFLASSYVDVDGDDDDIFQENESEMAQNAIIGDAFSSCGLGARDLEFSSFDNVDVGVERRDYRDFGDIIDFGEHACPAGKQAACCASGRPETVHGAIRMRGGCTTWGEFSFLSFFLSFFSGKKKTEMENIHDLREFSSIAIEF